VRGNLGFPQKEGACRETLVSRKKKSYYNIIYYNKMSGSSYTFNNMGRIGLDATDLTQRNMHNTRFSNYMLSEFFSDKTSDSQVKFATQQPTMMFSSSGVAGSVIDVNSMLTLKTEQERPLEKLMLNTRPFVTVPYLGRGSCDPTLESQLQQGEIISDRKSVSTIMEQSFSNYVMYPTDTQMEERVKNPAYTVEEAALNGWVRGGQSTRNYSKN
jgi:hypothetical protein